MEPPQPTLKPEPPLKPKTARSEQEMDAYAQSLLKMVNLDTAERAATKPSQKQFFSKKRMAYLVVSTVIGIILTIVISHALGSKGGSGSGTSQTKQLVHSVQTFDNPSSY